ncbi:hypothetical protein HanLR1_Chr07g0260571 [Helianthus annuus]|nr:hypothetical protein HanLR1_Chr07g0260571 [Helianthus annuus]
MWMMPVCPAMWCWWVIWYFWSLQPGFYMREVTFRDEIDYTQNTKSLSFNTLTVNQIFLNLVLGGIEKGWAAVSVFSTGGWVYSWAGCVWLDWYNWDGHYVGWVGVIRGVWVVNHGSYSGSHLVVCFFLLFWSLGNYNYIMFFFTPSLRLLIRGHLRRLVHGFVSGIDVFPGDIRKDQLGGLSLRCSPICIPTPKLESHLGFRNLYFPANSFVVWWLGMVGWVRGLASIWWWPNKLVLYYKDHLVTLGWANLGSLMLLDLSERITFLHVIMNWLHQIGLLRRNDCMYILLVWIRGNIVINDWDNFSTMHCELIWKFLLCFCVWMIKLYNYLKNRQSLHSSYFYYRGRIKKAGNLAVVLQGLFCQFRLDLGHLGQLRTKSWLHHQLGDPRMWRDQTSAAGFTHANRLLLLEYQIWIPLVVEWIEETLKLLQILSIKLLVHRMWILTSGMLQMVCTIWYYYYGRIKTLGSLLGYPRGIVVLSRWGIIHLSLLHDGPGLVSLCFTHSGCYKVLAQLLIHIGFLFGHPGVLGGSRLYWWINRGGNYLPQWPKTNLLWYNINALDTAPGLVRLHTSSSDQELIVLYVGWLVHILFVINKKWHTQLWWQCKWHANISSYWPGLGGLGALYQQVFAKLADRNKANCIGLSMRLGAYLWSLESRCIWIWKAHRLLGFSYWIGPLKAHFGLDCILSKLGKRPPVLPWYPVHIIIWAYIINKFGGLCNCFLGPGFVSVLKAQVGLLLIRRGRKVWLFSRTFGIIRSHGSWCILPRLNRHFCIELLQRWLGSIASIMSDYARYFCTPKRGRMVSYFWSPEFVPGMIRGYAPWKL